MLWHGLIKRCAVTHLGVGVNVNPTMCPMTFILEGNGSNFSVCVVMKSVSSELFALTGEGSNQEMRCGWICIYYFTHLNWGPGKAAVYAFIFIKRLEVYTYTHTSPPHGDRILWWVNAGEFIIVTCWNKLWYNRVRAQVCMYGSTGLQFCTSVRVVICYEFFP